MCSIRENTYLLWLDKVVGCVDIQTINHGHAYKYNLEVMMPVVAYLNYIAPTYYTFNGSIALLDGLLVTWGNHSSGNNNVKGMLAITKKSFGKVSTLTVIHTTYKEHHPSTLRLKITVFDALQRLQASCRILNESLHATVGHIGYRRALLAKLTDPCVTGTCIEPTLYLFVLLLKFSEPNKQMTMLCFDIIETNSDVESILTVTILDIMTQSLRVSNQKIYVQLVDVSVMLYYEKIQLYSLSTMYCRLRI